MRVAAREVGARALPGVSRGETGAAGRRRLSAWAAGLAAAAVFFALALFRHLSFHSAAYDLGFFDQVLWNASRGHGLGSTFLPYDFFGEHFEPALLLFVPLYRLVPSPVWLLGAQSLALGLAVVPLRAAAQRLAGEMPAWMVVAAYLLQLGVARAVDADFHTETLAVPFVFLAILFAIERRWQWFLPCAFVPMFAKEDGALVAIGVGIIAFLLTRKSITLTPMVTGLAYGAAVLFWFMPAIRNGAPGDLILRYGYLGSAPGEVAVHALTRPGLWISHVLTSPFLPALLMLLAAVGFLPLLRPAVLAVAILPLLPAFLSNDQYQAGLGLQYAIPAVPLLFIAALLGWQRIAANPGAVALLAGAAITWLWMAPVLPRLATDLAGLSRVSQVDRVLAAIPAGDEVAASSGLVAHLSERPAVWEFPAGFGARWVAIDQAAGVSQESQAFGYAAAVARLPGAGYRVAAQGAGVTVWRKSP